MGIARSKTPEELWGFFMAYLCYDLPMFETVKAYDDGTIFKQEAIEHYFLDYHQNPTSEILFITFEGLFPKMDLEPWQRWPWGARFLIQEGHSVLGIKTTHSCWYRNKALHQALESQELKDILAQHKRVIFYGESMGGYAALAFSSIHKGSEVLCFGPQTSLDENITPWDDRYTKYGRTADWSGPFADAAKELQQNKRTYVVYDPFCPYDSKHIARLPQDQVTLLKAPFLDHEVAAYISGFQLLKPCVHHLLNNSLEEWFPKAIRIRKTANVYLSNVYYNLAKRAFKKGDLDLAIDHATKALEENIKNIRAVNFAKQLIQKKQSGI